MLTYIVRRILLLFPTLLGVLAVVFFVMAYAPGGFGGTELTEDGAQTEGQDAKRAQKALERRYGLDLPRPAQFGRWLNQVSPVGFAMSGDLELTEEQAVAVAAALADQPFNTRPTRLERAVALVETVAAYTAEPAEAVAAELAESLASPAEALAWFDTIDASLTDAERQELQGDLVRLRSAESRGLERAQQEFLQVLAFEASGRSRVRFDRPRLKVPDLGISLRGRAVSELLWEAVPITILLNVLSIPIIYVVAIGSGVYAARRKGGWFDLVSGVTFLGLWSVPVIWAGVLLITYLCNEQYLRWFPAAGLHDPQADRMAFLPNWGGGGFERGWLLDMSWHLVLPVMCMVYGGFAVMSKVMRGAMLDSISADYVRTARAKGLADSTVLWQHAFRNSILPLITMASSLLPALFVGSVIVETIFSINGMGRLSVQAAFQKDREVVMATTLIAGMLGLFSELLRDLCYAIADPRVSYD
jgi:ABC-type dipeptide/oligopeptide/nickel transport system permease component